jgi:hypothetical protein
MTDCSRLSDRMPAVVTGRAEWTPEEARHLSGCQSCQDEWKLVRMVNQLGGEWGREGDLASISQAVLRRVEQGRVARRRRAWSVAGLAAAATLAAVIWTQRPVSRPPVSAMNSAPTTLQIPLPELDRLQPAELDSVLQAMDEPGLGTSTPDTPELGDLDSEELQSVLDFWEG